MARRLDSRTAAAGEAIRYCVIADDAVGDQLDRMVEGKKIAGRDLRVERIADPGQMQKCHILFTGATAPRELRRLIEAVCGRNVLTVGKAWN